ncbi:MAG: L-alanine dehydrogenase [uncultured archaeon A07HR60]|nr:MAG: L-alanine dehydrogenase [uncultured archaeon A07HR60]
MKTLLLNSAEVDKNAQIEKIIDALEAAFRAYERGDVEMPPKSYIDLPQYNGDFRSMPAYLDAGEWDAAGLKWVNVHPDNEDQFGMPTVMGTVVYSDPETAFPLAVMDGTELTKKRTGAAAAVATDHLAIPDARSLGLVGAGVQAVTQLEAISTVRPIKEVVVTDVDEVAAAQFVDQFAGEFDVRAGSVAEVAGCDVVSTLTPVTDPIVPRDAVGEHTHINSMGADAAGKHELEDEILMDAKLTIDDYEQCTHSGEINVPWSAGLLSDDDLHGEIGAIVGGSREGRNPDDGITVFDSTGLAIQDIAAARVVFEYADKNGNGYPFDLLGVA